MGSLNNFLAARRPVARYVTYVLSNGASLRLPIAIQQAGPRFASMVRWHAGCMACKCACACHCSAPVVESYPSSMGQGYCFN
eukprot:361839-Chlamydomonas_euryale.AAC.11